MRPDRCRRPSRQPIRPVYLRVQGQRGPWKGSASGHPPIAPTTARQSADSGHGPQESRSRPTDRAPPRLRAGETARVETGTRPGPCSAGTQTRTHRRCEHAPHPARFLQKPATPRAAPTGSGRGQRPGRVGPPRQGFPPGRRCLPGWRLPGARRHEPPIGHRMPRTPSVRPRPIPGTRPAKRRGCRRGSGTRMARPRPLRVAAKPKLGSALACGRASTAQSNILRSGRP